MEAITRPKELETDRAALIERAASLTPNVAERAAECETLRRLPDETAQEFVGAKLYRAWVPRRFGGYELDLLAGIECMQALAAGCSSSGWCLSVYQQHNWIVANFDEAAQQETIGADPDVCIPGVLSPRGTARRVEGGYRLNGFWPFASGSDHGAWILLGALVVDDEGKEVPLGREVNGVPGVNSRLCLVPIADVVNRGDWHAAGLAGTGSHSVTADEVFVPDHRAMSIPDAIEGRAPGRAINEGSLFQTAYYPFLHVGLAGPALGIAQGMLDRFIEGAQTKKVQPQNALQAELTRTHRQAGEAAARIDAAKSLLAQTAERIMEAAYTDRPLSAQARIDARLNAACVVDLCYQAVEGLFFASGGSALALGNPMQRAMRDMHAVKAHYFMDLEALQELSGMVRLGRKPNSYVF